MGENRTRARRPPCSDREERAAHGPARASPRHRDGFGVCEDRAASRLRPRLAPSVPAFKPAYLLHGDDHGRLAERRATLRALAERESGQGGLEVFEGDAATPENLALALRAMTFALGRRFLIADGAERWSET